MGPSTSTPAWSHAPRYPSSARRRSVPRARAVLRTSAGAHEANAPAAHGSILARCGVAARRSAPVGLRIIPGASRHRPGRWTGTFA